MSVHTRYEPEVLTLTQAAITCGVHASTMRRWADEGVVPTVRLPSGRRAVLLADLAGSVERTHRTHADLSADRRKLPR